MGSTLYVLAMMLARFVIPLLLLLLFSSWVEQRQATR
jgi:hypothetical protein